MNMGACSCEEGVLIVGNAGESAGAYMKGGTLIIAGKTKGYVGANLKGEPTAIGFYAFF